MLIVYKHTETYLEVIEEIISDKSLTVFEALKVAGVDMDEYASSKGWESYDPNALGLCEDIESVQEVRPIAPGIELTIDYDVLFPDNIAGILKFSNNVEYEFKWDDFAERVFSDLTKASALDLLKAIANQA